MRFLKYILLLLVILCFKISYSQTYTVTSNADSGPSTLREALTQAAGINRTTPFIINFNLPGDPSNNINRTIRLKTALPIVSSNLVIDGSSQPWPALGVSGAKIILEPEYTNSTFSGLVIGQYSSTGAQTSGVEIYGLYIRNFASITNLQTVNMSQGSGIIIDYRANNITIGAPNKGNVIGGNINGIIVQNSYYYSTITASKIKIQSNLIGVIYDGITPNTNVVGISANLYDCALDIGGDNTGEGNVVAANRINIDVTRSSYTTNTRFDVNVINNKIGADYTGKKDFHDLPIFLTSSALEIAGLKVNAINTALYIRNNIVAGNRTTGISITNADFILTGNAIGTDALGTISMGNGLGIKIESSAAGTIGGATQAEANLIANNNFGIESVSARPVKITRNSMYCNKTFGIGKTLNIFQPVIQILKKNSNYVSGKATPNSEIELFYTSNCQGICEGKTYIATVQAGSDGRWEYNGVLSGLVSATASLLNATTSPFSTAELLPNEAIVEPVTCMNNGSITIPEDREGFTFSWVKIETDGSRLAKGNTQSISGLDVGTYEVTISDGCKAFATVFIIKDQKLTKPNIIKPSPICGQTSFTFTAEVLRGKGTIKYTWINTATNATVAITNPATLPEGTYIVRAQDEAGCIMNSDPVTVNRKPQPKISNANLVTTAAACGKLNGSIKGITISDQTGTLSYKWYYVDPVSGKLETNETSTSLDLIDVQGGNYVLFVYDQGECSPVQQSYYISIYNTVAISNATITPARCGADNGVIDFVSITDADTFEWFSPTGTSLKKGSYSAGQSLKITDLAAGTYTLKASNTLSSCATSKNFTVTTLAPTIYTYTTRITPATCGQINGGISVDFSSAIPILPTSLEWRDEAGTLIPFTRTANVIEIKNLPAGNYKMIAKDANSCTTVLGPFTIELIPVLNVVANTGIVVNDGCNLKRGSITGVKVIGGLPNYEFKWINEKGEAVQYTKDLVNATAGQYRLEVKDATTCGYAITEAYTIIDVPFDIESPILDDIRICYATDIVMPIKNSDEGSYQLFADLNSPKPILEGVKNAFKFRVTKSGDYYARRIVGSCASPFTKVHIEVTHDNIEITNTITPNGDGKNDYWQIRGLPDFKGNNIKIYTRAGQLVYESIGNYDKPFDGRFRGEELPAGVYYYVIDLRTECKPLSGSLTLLR